MTANIFIPSVEMILLAFALVRFQIANCYIDEDGFDDEADSQEFEPKEPHSFEDEDGNFVKIWDEPDDETIEETEADIDKRVFFYLYTQQNCENSQEIIVDDDSTLINSNWKAFKLTRIVTHGWLGSHKGLSCGLIRDAYLKNGDHNVILVDWSKIAMRSYGFAVRRVPRVANYVARMIDFLERNGLDVSELVVVGHSLGAHVAGISALRARNTVGYVIALDPAGPFFDEAGPDGRVDRQDANHVQVIHTNAGELGLDRVLGDMEFYPNGGHGQNGCGPDIFGTCAHSRSYKYFAESINTRIGFWAQLCTNWKRFRYRKCLTRTTTIMGGNVPIPVPASGIYFLSTSDSPEFALGPIED